MNRIGSAIIATGLPRPHSIETKVGQALTGRQAELLEINKASKECEMKRSEAGGKNPETCGVVGG